MQSPGENGRGRWPPCGWRLGRIRQGEGRPLGGCTEAVTHTGGARTRRAWSRPTPLALGGQKMLPLQQGVGPGRSVCGEPRARGQAPRGLAAASDLSVLEESGAGCAGRAEDSLPAHPRVFSPDLPPNPRFGALPSWPLRRARGAGRTWQRAGLRVSGERGNVSPAWEGRSRGTPGLCCRPPPQPRFLRGSDRGVWGTLSQGSPLGASEGVEGAGVLGTPRV